jgi:hypothetical protein
MPQYSNNPNDKKRQGQQQGNPQKKNEPMKAPGKGGQGQSQGTRDGGKSDQERRSMGSEEDEDERQCD